LKLATKGILSLAAITAATSTIAFTDISPANALTFKITHGIGPDPAQFAPSGGSTITTFNSDAGFTPGQTITSLNFGDGVLTATNAKIAGDGDDNQLQLGSKGKPAKPSIGSKGKPAKPSKPAVPAVQGNAKFVFNDAIPYVGLFWRQFLGTDYIDVFLKGPGTPKRFFGDYIKGKASSGDGEQFYLNFYEPDVTHKISAIQIFSTGGNIDNVAYRVPTPALLPGLIGMGLAAWRKRKGEEAEQAEA